MKSKIMPNSIKLSLFELPSIKNFGDVNIPSKIGISITQAEKKFAQIINQIFAKKFPKKIAVGVSGGADSMALAFLLQKICQQKKCELICVTIDHKLRAKSSDEAKSVAKTMKQNYFNHVILKSYLDKSPAANIEASMREMRYNLLSEFCVENNIEYLFIAHHKQDIAENFLIRLFRGSGIDGLSALDYISEFKEMKLVRPLLDFEKSELEEYLLAKKILWFYDESNDDEKYLRNKIRKFLLSLEDHKLISERILLASRSILESRQLIQELMIERADEVLQFFDLGYFLLNLDKFKKLPKQMAWRYLAWALIEVSDNYYKPRFEDLDNLYQWIINDKNHKPRSLHGCIVQKYDDKKLIIYREKSKIKSAKLKNNLLWDGRFLIKVSLSKFDDVIIETLNSTQLNQLSQQLPELKKLKDPLKKIYCTLPILKKQNKIIAIPHLNFPKGIAKEIVVTFKSKTKLTINENRTLPN